MPTIRVVARFRPINEIEKLEAKQKGWNDDELCPLYVDETHLMEFGEYEEKARTGTDIRCEQDRKVKKKYHPRFAFDEILPWVNQQTAFEKIGLPVVKDALNGINGTIFAYGQTGSGKIY